MTTAPMIDYAAIIEGINKPAGTYYSIERGQQPYTEIHVRVLSQDTTQRPTRLKITILGLYSKSELGDIGNVVTFSYAGDVRLRDAISIDQLANYKVSIR